MKQCLKVQFWSLSAYLYKIDCQEKMEKRIFNSNESVNALLSSKPHKKKNWPFTKYISQQVWQSELVVW